MASREEMFYSLPLLHLLESGMIFLSPSLVLLSRRFRTLAAGGFQREASRFERSAPQSACLGSSSIYNRALLLILSLFKEKIILCYMLISEKELLLDYNATVPLDLPAVVDRTHSQFSNSKRASFCLAPIEARDSLLLIVGFDAPAC